MVKNIGGIFSEVLKLDLKGHKIFVIRYDGDLEKQVADLGSKLSY